MMRHALAGAGVVLLAAVSRMALASDASGLPPSEEMAKDRLNASPRHGEFATVDVRGTAVRTWIVYPERKDRAPVVLVIHEIFGLTDWVRAVADQLAAEGFLALAPDLLSGKGPGGGGTEAYASRDDAVRAVSELPRDEVIARLNAVRSWALGLPAASRTSATIGFCWGGSTSFAYAVAQPALEAAVVYYGTAPADLATLAAVKAPVLGLYGSNDARVDATLAATGAKMKELGKAYEPHVFDGAGHGFLRAQGGQDGANMTAAAKAWPLTVAFLRRHLRWLPLTAGVGSLADRAAVARTADQPGRFFTSGARNGARRPPLTAGFRRAPARGECKGASLPCGGEAPRVPKAAEAAR